MCGTWFEKHWLKYHLIFQTGDDSIEGDEGVDVPVVGEQLHPVARIAEVDGRERHLKKFLPFLRRHESGTK